MSDEPHTQIRQTQPELRETQPPATREAPVAAQDWAAEVWERPWLGFALSALLPGLMLSLLGPFGTFAAPMWMRFAYWMPTMAIGATIGAALTISADRACIFDRRPVARVAALTTAMTIAMTAVAWNVSALVFGPGKITFSLTFVFYVWVITVIVTVIVSILRAKRVAVAAAPVERTATSAPATLSQRLPDKLRTAAILALQGEDHYVRVHTTAGSDLILIRLSDAMAQMGSTPGARTHRSWWVAKSAVKTVRRANGRVALVLANDVEAPISRGYAGELREAGWLDNAG